MVALQHFNIIKSVGIDYLHCVLLGVEKRLINFFYETKNSKSKFYITKAKRKRLNARILSIKTIREVNRKPRSLEKRCKFTASEFRSMLLYYLPVCLPGCLPNLYIQHFRLLSAATYILLKSTITRSEMNEAEGMLHRFVQQHQRLFGVQNMVMNVHLLKHLVQDVRSLGPLWCHSTFPFERNNGVLLKKAIGTTDVLQQISSKFCLSKAIINGPKVLKANEKVLLGKSVKVVESSLRVFHSDDLQEIDLSNKELYVHKRINLKHTIYTSTLYTLPQKSVDYFIELNNDIIGKAKFYFESDGKVHMVLEEYEVYGNIDHIMQVRPTHRNIVAAVDKIRQKYIYMNVGLNEYIVSVPNPYEKE